jgi:threonine synthase
MTKGLLYKSTRGSLKEATSSEAIINGIAEDGGLYVPSCIPDLDPVLIPDFVNLNYSELAQIILPLFLTDFSSEEIKSCVEKAYDSKFDSPEIVPLTRAGDVFFLELYHGATAAFKDLALSILPHMLTIAAAKVNLRKNIVILTATSGDTGKAALESFAGVRGVKIIVFYPNNGVSLIQERQMTTQMGENTYICAIEGNFDDAQTGVKKIFNDAGFNRYLMENNLVLSSANSINIGRLIPQIVYYYYAYLQLVRQNEIENGQFINLLVPTGNFGNILAAYYAKKMGLPVQRLICASNENNILYDFINTGVYDKRRNLKLTMSPSMDILISSNLERLIYDIYGNDAENLKKLFEDLKSNGYFSIAEDIKEKIADFWAGYATETQTLEAIKKSWVEKSCLIDTHTAVGYHVYCEYREATNDRTKTVIAATASPFKFPASVLRAIDCNFDTYKDENEFQMLRILSDFTGCKIPGPLEVVANLKIRHNNICTVDEMQKFVLGSLGLRGY